MTANASTKNDTRLDDIEEARRLLLDHVLKGLREGNPKASFLAVANKVLAEEAERLSKMKLPGFGSVDLSNLPFNTEDDGQVTAPASASPAPAGGSQGSSPLDAYTKDLPFPVSFDE